MGNLNDPSSPSTVIKPLKPNSVLEDAFTTDTHFTPSITWAAPADPTRAKFQIAIGTTPGGSDVVNWTDQGSATSAILPTSTLLGTLFYYASVRTVNFDGATSDIVTGNGFAYVPPPSMSFTYDGSVLDQRHQSWRGTSGTAGYFYDSSGTLKLAPTNFSFWTEDFTNSVWAKSAATITANAVAAPSNVVTADKLVATAATSAHFVRESVAGVVTGTTYTFSVFVKPSEYTQVQLSLGNAFPTTTANFDLTNGTVTATTGSPTAAVVTTSDNGYYRLSITQTATATSTANAIISLMSGGSTSFLGDGTSGVFVWGSQLEDQPAPTTYIPNTTAKQHGPRFDHDPSTCALGVCANRGYLNEQGRTNVALQSEDFATTWTPTNATVAVNITTAPNAKLTADSIIEASGSSLTPSISQSFASLTGGAAYAASVFVKPLGRTRLAITVAGSSDSATTAFDLTGSGSTLQACNAVTGTGSLLSSRVQALPNGWYRIALAAKPVGTTGAATLKFSLIDHDCNTTYTGDGVSGVALWGAQLESGFGMSSYIPTLAASVARGGDNFLVKPISTWINPASGTVAVSLAPSDTSASYTGYFPYAFRMCDSSNCNVHKIEIQGQAAQFLPLIYDNPAYYYVPGSFLPIASGVFQTAAVRYVVGDINGAFGGSLGIAGGGTQSIPTLDEVAFTGSAGYMKSIKYWNTPLTDIQLKQISK